MVPKPRKRRRSRKINVPCANCGSVQRRSEASVPDSKIVFCRRCKGAKGENHWNFKDGQYIDRAGYRMILVNGRYEREHRHIWKLYNGAVPLPGAQVHHIDQDKLNNSPDNLLLLSATEHAQVHRAIDNKKWYIAIRILKMAALRQPYYPKNVGKFILLHGSKSKVPVTE